MKKKNQALVTISSLALSAAPFAIANAQVQITCGQRLYLGQHDACNVGFLTIEADGGTSINGCLVTAITPQPGQCVLSTGGTAVTKNVIVKFASTSIFVTSGGSQSKVSTLMMIHPGTGTSATKFTFTPTQVSNGVTLDIGGRFNFNTGLPLGTYTGSITISADLVP